jgi:hypothetical protein
MTNYSFSEVSVDSEIFSVTDFMNLKIKLTHVSIVGGLSCRGGRGIIDNSRAVMSCPPCRGHGVVAVALTGLVLLPGQTLLLVACLFPSATAGLVQLSVKWQTQHSSTPYCNCFFCAILQ